MLDEVAALAPAVLLQRVGPALAVGLVLMEEEDDLDKLLKTMSSTELNLLEKAAYLKTNTKHAMLRAERSKCAQQ